MSGVDIDCYEWWKDRKIKRKRTNLEILLEVLEILDIVHVVGRWHNIVLVLGPAGLLGVQVLVSSLVQPTN